MKFSVVVFSALCAVAGAIPATSPTAVLPEAKRVVEIPIVHNINFNKSFVLLYARAMERFVKRNEIIQREEDAEAKRLVRRAKAYGLPDPVRRYGFGDAVQRGTSSTSTTKSSSKTSSTAKVTTSAKKTTSSTLVKTSSLSSSSSRPATTSTQGVFHAVATNIAYDSMYLASVVIGSQRQNMNVVYDTGSSDLWVFTTECTNCQSKSNLFNPLLSLTYVKSSTPYSITYGDGSWTKGHTGSDIISIGGAQFRQGIDITTSVSSNLLDNQLDGILGLGFGALMSVSGTPTIMDNLWNNNVIKQNLFGVQLIKYDESPTNGGKWTFGGYDSSVIRGPLATAPLTRKAWWEIAIPTIRIGSKKSFTPSSTFIVDTGTTLILLSKSDCDNIYSALPGGKLSSSGYYTLWCNATSSTYSGRRNVYFNIGGTDFGVPASDILWERVDGVNCYGGIQSWGSGNGVSILGDVFLKNVYTVFDVGNVAVKVGQRTDVVALTD